MKLVIEDLDNGGWIAARFAFGVQDAEEHVRLGDNHNPAIHWSQEPAGTRTLVLLCYDDDVPARADDVNREDRTIPRDFPRMRFYHWVMVDIAPGAELIPEADVSDEVTPRGKHPSKVPAGARQGLNDFTGFLQGDPQMTGKYYGYDGPCPPWNDERMHHYHFVLYATDLERCPVEGDFTGADVEAAIAGHVLESAIVTGRYSLYLPLLGKA